MQPVSPVHSYSKVAPDEPEPTKATEASRTAAPRAGYAPWFGVITALFVTAVVHFLKRRDEGDVYDTDPRFSSLALVRLRPESSSAGTAQRAGYPASAGL